MTDKFSVELSTDEWDAVMRGLYELPKKIADPICSKIQASAQAYFAANRAMETPVPEREDETA